MTASRVWIVTGQDENAARWARLLFRLGAESGRVRELRALEAEGAGGLALIDWDRIASDPKGALDSLRGKAPGVETVILFGAGAPPDPARVLEAGVLDILSAEGSDEALSERLKGHVERFFPRTIESGAIRVDLDRRAVSIRGEAGAWRALDELTPKEFGLLRLFVQTPGIPQGRGELMSRVWDDDEAKVNLEAVDKQVSSLRRKLGAEGKRIRTLRGVGYLFEEAR